MSIIVENHGAIITASNYWLSDLAAAGKLFVSPNAGAIRILIPPQARDMIEAARLSRYAILSRGPWPEMGLTEAVEIVWEDGSDNPYVVTLGAESFAMLPGEPDAGREWTISIWDAKKGKPHRAVERPCHWRRVEKIPCMLPCGG